MRPIEPFSRLKYTRRQLLEFLLMLSAWLPASVLLAAASGDPNPTARSLAAFLDQLLPEDGLSPGASQVGVDTAILAEARADSSLGRLVEMGIALLDEQARKQGVEAFHDLAEDQQLLIILAMERQRPGTLPRVFFENLRHRAFGHYYADPRSWSDLRYAGPPQPRGFAHHDQSLAEVAK